MGAVISFFRPASTSQGGWSQQELAEFYRVEAALVRAGLQIGSEQGLSDEAEPWFVFCRPDGDAIMHFARIDGSYVIASEVLDSPMRGSDFRALINQIAQRYPGLLPIPQGADGTKLSVHPAALLAALVAAAALSLSSHDALAADQAQSRDEQGQAGQTLPTESPSAADTDERDSHRKQFGVIVFSAMIFAADVFAADHVEQGTEPSLNFGSQGGNSVAAWEQDGAPVPAGEVMRPVNASAPLASGTRDHAPTGTSGLTTAEATAAVLPQAGSADVGTVGLEHPTLGHGPAQPSLEPAYQISAQALEASTTRTAGSSSSPEARSDAGVAASASAEGLPQAGPSPVAAGEAASQAPSATPATGHSAHEMPSAQVDGLAAPTQFDLNRSASLQRDDGARGQEHAARHGLVSDEGLSRAVSKIADTDHSGTSDLDHSRPGAVGHGVAIGADAGQVSVALQLGVGGPDRGDALIGALPGKSAEAPGQLKEAGSAAHGVDGHGAAIVADAGQVSVALQLGVGGPDRGHPLAGALPGKSAEAPGQLKETGPAAHGADGHGPADGADAGQQSSVSRVEARGADPDHAQANASNGKSAEAPGQLKETGPAAHGADGHGPADGADAGQQSSIARSEGSSPDQGHAQASASNGKSAEAPGQLKETGPASHGADGPGAGDGADAGQQSGALQVGGSNPDRGHAQAGPEVRGAFHVNNAGAAEPGSQVNSGRSPDTASADTPAHSAGDQPSLAGQMTQAGAQSQAQSRAAHVDFAGNLVFSSDARNGHAATPSHTAADAGTHDDVGLVGLSDHGANMHHIDLHS